MQRGKQVISRLNDFKQYSIMYQTYHTKDRIGRLSKYNFGKRVDAFNVNANHKNGLEVHIVDDLGYIQVFNKYSMKFITAMSGRPKQLKKYYVDLGLEIPNIIKRAIKIAYDRNDKLNYNNI